MASSGRSRLPIIGAVFGGIVLLLAMLVGCVAVWLPGSFVARDLQVTLSEKLGRPVRLTGGVHLELWPIFGVEARGFSIGNVPGGEAANLVEADAVDVGIAPLSLLAGRIEIRQVGLTRPRIHLEKLADGRVNWALGAARSNPSFHTPEWIKDISVENLSIRSGLVGYADLRANGRQAIDRINVTVKLAGLDKPGQATGDFALDGEAAKLDLTVGNPRALLNGAASPLRLNLNSKLLTLALAGSGGFGAGPLTGTVEASGPSLRELARIAGTPLKPSPGLGAFRVKARLTRDGQVIRLEGADVAIDHLRAAGDVVVDLREKRPLISGSVSMPDLDLNPYLGPERPLPASWPRTPISLAGLRAFDSDLAISAGRVRFRRVTATRARLHARINDGAAHLVLQQMSLYGGSGSGQLVVADASNGGRYGAQFALSGVSMKELLSDLANIDRVEGQGRVDLNLTAAGGSVDAIMHSLGGQMTLDLADGAVRGVDLAAVSTSIASTLSGTAIGPDARTSFSRAGGAFMVSRGVAATRNLALAGPGVGVSGVGKIDLGERSLDMVIKPQGGLGGGRTRVDLGAVPFHVHGPWTHLSYEPDLGGAVQRLLGQQVGAFAGDRTGGIGSLLAGFGGAASPADGAVSGSGAASRKGGNAPPEKRKTQDVVDLLGGLVPR
jgi:AsmA protein